MYRGKGLVFSSHCWCKGTVHVFSRYSIYKVVSVKGKSFIWSWMHKIFIIFFQRVDYFQLWLLYKVTFCFRNNGSKFQNQTLFKLGTTISSARSFNQTLVWIWNALLLNGWTSLKWRQYFLLCININFYYLKFIFIRPLTKFKLFTFHKNLLFSKTLI